MTDFLDALTAFRPLQTPALVLYRPALERNLGRMQQACAKAGVRLRAHGKTHKCSRLALRQVELGAVGLCAQTVGEAEAFAAAGVSDVLVTSPHPPWGAVRLAALAGEGRRISAVADDADQIARLAAAAQAANVGLEVVVDLDLGQHRSGASVDQAEALVRLASSSPGLRWRGLQAYLGHLQHLADPSRRAEANTSARERLRELVQRLRSEGLSPEIVTGGGTGTYTDDLQGGVFTELQAGSYAVMDVEYGDCGAPDGGAWTFEPAMAIAATVVSARHKTHVVVDAGLKSVSVDGPPARVLIGAPAGAVWRPMGDEHGAIFTAEALPLLRQAGRDPLAFEQVIDSADRDGSLPWPADAPDVGQVVWLQPGHCDPTSNLYDAFVVLDGDGSAEIWPVDARRRTPSL